ncbi:MAG TPA: hypothetical protein VGG40_10265 [Solirubrobacterales bacterium]
MELLRNFLGNLSSGVIRLLVTVGILAAVGFFIVKPILDKTGEITRESNETLQKSLNQGFGKNGAGLKDVNKTLREVNKTVKREIKKSMRFAEKHTSVASPKKLVECIRRADGEVHKIQRCTVKF